MARFGGRTATIAHGGLFDDVFLFEQVPGGRWAVAVAVAIGSVVLHRLLKLRRRREQLRRRRQIRARLHGTAPAPLPVTPAPPPVTPARPPVVPAVTEIDLTEPGAVIDLRDGAVYGSEITLESGDTLESGIVGPFPKD